MGNEALQRKPYQPTELKKHQTRKYKTAVKKRKWRSEATEKAPKLTKTTPTAKRKPVVSPRGALLKRKRKTVRKRKHKEKHHA